MEILIRHTEGCPHIGVAESRTRDALDRLGIDATIDFVLVRTATNAQRMGFVGSPTIFVDGKDPFPGNGEPALACRMYATVSGLEGAPSVEQILSVLKESTR